MIATATYLINSDVGGNLVMARDENGDTPAHDAADNGLVVLVLSLASVVDTDLYRQYVMYTLCMDYMDCEEGVDELCGLVGGVESLV